MCSCFLFPEYINMLHALFCLTDESSIDCSGGCLKERQSVRKAEKRWDLLTRTADDPCWFCTQRAWLYIKTHYIYSLHTAQLRWRERCDCIESSEKEVWFNSSTLISALHWSSHAYHKPNPKAMAEITSTFDFISVSVGFISSNSLFIHLFVCNSNL